MTLQRLPRPAPARVLAVGAQLKNRACLLDGARVHWSPPHGDLDAPPGRVALGRSIEALRRIAGGRIDAVAHDLHPDFASTLAAREAADRLGVPAIAVQHHHAHVGVVQAEAGVDGAGSLVALTLDGFGLGTDGSGWGGEVLVVRGVHWERVAHLTPLAQPGGDAAAREPWRMAASVLHALGRGDEIERRFAPDVGAALARGVRDLLARDLNCPRTTSAGRWFDAVAGLAGLSVRQGEEAEAAIALEAAAARWLEAHVAPAVPASGLDVLALAAACAADRHPGAAAARFHVGLADGLADAAVDSARRVGASAVVLAGGCFHNRVLTRRLVDRLCAAALRVLQPGRVTGPGDAGLALGQAWIAAHRLASGATDDVVAREDVACA